MLLMHFNIVHEWRLTLGAASYLIAKGIIFRGSFMSTLDILAGVYIIFIMLGLRTFLVYLFFAFMVYKIVTYFAMRA